jgi:hypothetical protein
MAERHDQQGTGRHGHKDTQEPWPHTKDNEGRQEHHGQQREHATSHTGGSHSSGQHGSESADLKRREYKDEKGEVHHHTRTYNENHDTGGHKGGSDRR